MAVTATWWPRVYNAKPSQGAHQTGVTSVTLERWEECYTEGSRPGTQEDLHVGLQDQNEATSWNAPSRISPAPS